MSKCPHCGAEGGKFHEPCPYAPGGKYYKAPGQRKPLPKKTEVVETPAGTFIHETAPIPEEVFDSSSRREKMLGLSDGPTEEARKRKTKELQSRADSAKTKAARPRSRAGKKAATLWLEPDRMKQLQIAAIEHGVSQEQILDDGLTEMLDGRYRP